MTTPRTILIQLDTDLTPSAFDRIVALDSGADVVLSYGGVRSEHLQSLVHGAIFTRSPDALKNTAFFVGGSDLAAGEFVFIALKRHMLPQYGLQVSSMIDSNGSNTTATAAVRAIASQIDLTTATVLVLGGTGPVGQRVARLLARAGADVRIGSREKTRADAVATAIKMQVPGARATAYATSSVADAPTALSGAQVVVAAGAPGTVLLPKKLRAGSLTLRVAVDLNAVPPAGIEGIEATDNAIDRDGVIAFGALGIGGVKMKIHRAAIAHLFTRNDLSLDVDQVFDLSANA